MSFTIRLAREDDDEMTRFAEVVESLSDDQLAAMRDLAAALERLSTLLK